MLLIYILIWKNYVTILLQKFKLKSTEWVFGKFNLRFYIASDKNKESNYYNCETNLYYCTFYYTIL